VGAREVRGEAVAGMSEFKTSNTLSAFVAWTVATGTAVWLNASGTAGGGETGAV
jgi:hypothetical protein